MDKTDKIEMKLGNYVILRQINQHSMKIVLLTFVDNVNYALKLFKLSELQDYNRQKQTLKLLKYHNIPYTIQFIQNFEITDPKIFLNIAPWYIIVTQNIRYGNLLNYLHKYKRIPKEIAKTYFKQIIECLLSCQKFQIVHKNLTPYDILIDGSFNIRICDWSHIKANKRQLIFSCGEILLMIIIGRPLFNTHTKQDPYYKFIETNKIQTFWAQLSRKTKLIFQQNLIQLVSKIFLDSNITYQDIISHPYLKNYTGLTPSQLQIQYLKLQDMLAKKIQKKQSQKQQQKKIFEADKNKLSTEISGNNKKRISSNNNLLNDYYSCTILENNLEIIQNTFGCIQIQQKISYVIAWFKKFFNPINKSELGFSQEIILNKSNIEEIQNYLFINLTLQEQDQIDDAFIILLKLQFFKNQQKKIYVRISGQNEEISSYYSSIIIKTIIQQIIGLNTIFKKNINRKVIG